jgi:hypothetical protein
MVGEDGGAHPAGVLNADPGRGRCCARPGDTARASIFRRTRFAARVEVSIGILMLLFDTLGAVIDGARPTTT